MMVEGNCALSEEQACRIIQLLAGVAVQPGDMTAKKRTLMSGLAELVKADAWMWTVSTLSSDTGELQPLELVMDGLDPNAVLAAANRRDEGRTEDLEPETAPFMSVVEPGLAVTRTRRQLLSDDEWYSHPHVQKYRLPSGVDDFVYSVYISDDRSVLSGLGFHRRPGREPFSPVDSRIIHIASSEITWLHVACSPSEESAASIRALPPRLRKTLVLLLQGKSRKEVASALYLSPHTVHGYAKEIYRALGVSGQAELLSHFLAGNGRDVDR